MMGLPAESPLVATMPETVGGGPDPTTILLLAKIGSMFILGMGSLLLGMLPLIIGRYNVKKSEHRRAITSVSSASTNLSASSLSVNSQADASQGLLTSLLLCFGGGVLLFTTFLHLAPEVRESVEYHQSKGQLVNLGTLSLAELLFCGGFFFVYFVEEAVHAALTNKPDSSEQLLYRTVSVRRCNHNSGSANSGNGNNNNNNNSNNNNHSGSSSAHRRNSSLSTRHHHQHHHHQQQQPTAATRVLSGWRTESSDAEDEVSPNSHMVGPAIDDGKDRPLVSASADRKSSAATNTSAGGPPMFVVLSSAAMEEARRRSSELMHRGGAGIDDNDNKALRLASDDTNSSQQQQQQFKKQPQPQQQQQQHGHKHSPSHVDNSVRSLLTVLALSFHAIFEGLAVGLEPAFSSVMYLAAAIATHKLVISFCVGMELYVAGASNRAILGYMSVFSMVTPLGIGVGLALGHFRNDSGTLGPTPTILQGMAAGTLLYVVFFEVLAREKANEKSGLLQLAAILVGFMLMLGLQIATAHSHDHGHSHGGHGDHEEIHNHEGEELAGDKHNYVIGAAIERVTDKVVDALSTSLT